MNTLHFILCKTLMKSIKLWAFQEITLKNSNVCGNLDCNNVRSNNVDVLGNLFQAVEHVDARQPHVEGHEPNARLNRLLFAIVDFWVSGDWAHKTKQQQPLHCLNGKKISTENSQTADEFHCTDTNCWNRQKTTESCRIYSWPKIDPYQNL